MSAILTGLMRSLGTILDPHDLSVLSLMEAMHFKRIDLMSIECVAHFILPNSTTSRGVGLTLIRK